MPRVRRTPIDRVLLSTIILLVVAGLFIFFSASLGLLAYNGSVFKSAATSQILFGLCGGMIALFVAIRVPYRVWRRYSPYFFVVSVLSTFLVFVPHLGVYLNGAHRWIDIGPLTIQPSEPLKIAYILYLATLLSAAKNKMSDFRYGLLPFAVVTGIVGFSLILEPDTGTFMIIATSGLAMFFAAGARWRDIGIMFLIGVIGIGALVAFRPYVAARFTTFLHPANDAQGAGYQVQQSLIAVGAGETFGRGFGQSLQKFGKLPEPISDSIFAVFAEEFGFFGSTLLLCLYVTFALRGFWVAARSPDLFGGLVALGIVVLVIGESFLNISAMIGIVPLSGFPLVFISHGGSALFIALGACGILLAVSRTVKT
ncbi:MAG: cell division protein FtsW [Patescibacteria group bacterium]|nr:cell division protein FtsW [Patescibacteria group bacterium]